MLRLIRLAGLIAAGCQSALAQTPAELPAFDSVSIKPSKADREGYSWHTRTAYIVMKNPSLRTLIAVAYGTPENRVVGGPKWSDSDRFEIEGRAAGPAQDPELLLMLRRMLAERFHVSIHRENRTTDERCVVSMW